MTDVNKAYRDEPRVSYNINNAHKMQSKTKQRVFVVASDVKRNKDEISYLPVGSDDIITNKVADRVFLIFHDLDHFLAWKHKLPYIHEIIHCPSKQGEYDEDETTRNKEYDDEMAMGRLIFDFDVETPLPSQRHKNITSSMDFVDINTFKPSIEYLIKLTFHQYYINVDTDKLIFIWQYSPNPNKFSMHLIVKHAYFNEYWVKQMKVFYTFLKKVASEETGFNELMTTIDFQIARRNATFRMIGSSKVNGYPLLLHSPPDANIYDCLVGIYDYEQSLSEQSISLDNLDYPQIENVMIESNQSIDTKQEKEFRHAIENHVYSYNDSQEYKHIVSDEEIEKAFKLFETWNDDDFAFGVRDIVGGIINLNRRKACACKISGRVHGSENAYLIMRSDGMLVFKCRRDCTLSSNGRSYLEVGLYKQRVINDPIANEEILNIKFPRLKITAPEKFNFKTVLIDKEDKKKKSPGLRLSAEPADQRMVKKKTKTVPAIAIKTCSDFDPNKMHVHRFSKVF